jgi:hypothetical protein
MLSVIKPNAIMLSIIKPTVIMLGVFMLNFDKPSVIMLDVIMPSVVNLGISHNAKCRYTECHGAVSWFTKIKLQSTFSV